MSVVHAEELPFGSGVRADPFGRVKPLARTAFDWLTIEAVWKAYKRFGGRGAAAVGIGLVFVWYIVIGVPLTVVIGVLSALGLSGSATVGNTAFPLALILATGIMLYGGSRTYSLIQDRRTMASHADDMNVENIADAFDYLDSRDDTVRVTASEVVAVGMSEAPLQVVNRAGFDEDGAAFALCDLLHDESEEVRENGILALAHFSNECPLHVAQYRDDVFAAMKYPSAVMRTNAALITGNMTLAEPRLGDEALRHLQPLCNSEDPDVREAAAMALGTVRDDRASELLGQLMDDPHPDVRQAAIEMRRQRAS